MNSFAFDTHAFFKSLTHAGMDEQQAEALLEFQKQLINDSLATKRDIGEVKASIEEVKASVEEVKASVEALRMKTEQSIEEVKASVEALRLKTEQNIEKLKVELEKVKSEVEKVKGEVEKVKGEVEKLRLEIKKDIKALELHLTLRLASVIVVTAGIFATLVKFLP